MSSRSLGHRAPLLRIVVPMTAGLTAGMIADLNLALWPLVGAAMFVSIAVVLHWRAPRRSMVALSASMFFAGAASYALNRPRIKDWDTLPPREVRLTVRVDRVFAQSDPKRASGLATIERADDPVQELAGQRVYFSLALKKSEAAPLRSAVISSAGILVALPRDPPIDSFDGYLSNAGINFRLTRGRVLVQEKPANAYQRFCARQAVRCAAILGAGVEAKRPGSVGVFRAIMLGQQNELSDDQRLHFRQSGTMHVFSISGMHIAVIAGGLHALLSLLRLPRVVQFILGLATLWLYVDITGCAPSAVRAFVMVALVQASLVLRVPLNPLSALTVSALLVLLVAPLQLFSASFQMSYGIVAALLLLGLPLADRWQLRFALFRDLPKSTWTWHQRFRDWLWRIVVSAGAIGVAAALVSTVTGVLYFKLFTPGAMLVNLWLIPAGTGVILAGFASLLCGFVGCGAGSKLANHAAVLLLWGIEHGVTASLSLPAMWFNASFSNHWFGSASLAALLATLAFGYAARWRGWHRGYWAPFGVVTAAMVFGVTFG